MAHLSPGPRWTLVCLLASAACVPCAVAQDNFDLGEIAPAKKPQPLFLNSIETGFGYQSQDTYHFARYGGIAEKGAFPILTGSLRGRDPWTSDNTRFWTAGVSLLGTDLRDLFVRYGQQGQWQVGAFYKGFTRHHTESAKTPYEGVGTSRLTLPANWITGNSSQRFTALEQSLKPLALKTEWQVMGGDAVLAPAGTGYELRFKFQRRTRDGLRADSLAFGHEANFPVGIFFAQPVDYTSNRMNASLSFANALWQWNAGYELSTFDNGMKSITVANPYSRSIGPPWPAGAFAGYPFAFGQFSLPPDNTAHQFSFSGGVALAPQTRLSGKLSYTIQKQNDLFLPYTTNPNLNAPVPLTRSSLDGDIRKTFLSLGLTSSEWKNVELSASYTYDERDNQTARELYSYIPNDVQDQVSAALRGVSRYVRYNLPRSFMFQRAKAEAAYRFTPRTRFSVTYNGDFKERTYQQLEKSNEHALKAKLLSGFDVGLVWASYSYGHRTGSGYVDAASWNASHTDTYINASPLNQSIEHPLLRTFNLADRVRHEAKGGFTFDVGTKLTVNSGAGFARETYPHTTYGRQKSKSLILDGDISYAFQDHLTASAFYSVERYRFAQAGYYITSNNLNNPNQVWGAQNKDTVRSLGANIDWQAIPQELKLSAAYYMSRGLSEINVQATPTSVLAVVAPLPDSREITHNAKLKAAYNVSPATVLKLGYTVEHHSSHDWQYDNVGYTSVAQIMGSGIVPPRYYVHVGSVTVAVQF